jgi:hypothetical protein
MNTDNGNPTGAEEKSVRGNGGVLDGGKTDGKEGQKQSGKLQKIRNGLFFVMMKKCHVSQLVAKHV